MRHTRIERVLLLALVLWLGVLPSRAEALWANPTVIATLRFVAPNINGGSVTAATSTATACGGNPCDFFIAVATAFFNVQPVVSDLVGGMANTWVPETFQTQSTNSGVRMFYANAGTGLFYTGGSHQFTITCTACYSGGVVLGFTGSYTAGNPGEAAGTGNNSAGTTVKPGSTTPTFADSLIVSVLSSGASAGADMMIDTMTKLGSVDYASGGSIAGAIAYTIQVGAATANDPTWSSATSTAGLATFIRAFRPAVAASAGGTRLTQGVGK